ncbi:MAG: sulfatase-like hydrolase/transferase [Planctomycetota bacterium]|jgi:arylsulfatase A-like enzyme
MKKHHYLTTYILVVSLLMICTQILAGQVNKQTLKPKPNILFILSDDQGYRDLGCFGGPEIKTPYLDQLATEGIRLTNFYVTCPACTPSRGSILTGRYPQRNGLYAMIRNNMVNFDYQYDEVTFATSPEMTLGLDLREITIAQPLKKAGYTTGIVGKWDSGRARRFLPLQRGFDFFYGFPNTGIDYYTHERYGIPSMFRGNQLIKEQGYATDLFRREALQFIRKNKDRPFFLYVPFNAPHGGSNLKRPGVQAPEKYIRPYGKPPNNKRARFMAAVTCMDQAIGEILDLLESLGLEDNTFIAFASDNGGGGPADNKPLRGRKARMFEGGVRVPFIARWPGRIPKNKTSHEFCSTLELFPTFLAAAGVQPPQGVILDGFNMLPLLTKSAKSQRKDLFWQFRYGKAARVGNFKWVESREGNGLFDLSTDLSEKHDLSTEKPEILQKVKARWSEWRKQMDRTEPRGPFRNY